eukprot:scaffold164870_cov30-Tisochrysis_lutea.AAC.4
MVPSSRATESAMGRLPRSKRPKSSGARCSLPFALRSRSECMQAFAESFGRSLLYGCRWFAGKMAHTHVGRMKTIWSRASSLPSGSCLTKGGVPSVIQLA